MSWPGTSRTINGHRPHQGLQQEPPLRQPSHTVDIKRPDDKHAIVKYNIANQIPSGDFRLFYAAATGGATIVCFHAAAVGALPALAAVLPSGALLAGAAVRYRRQSR